MIVVDILSKRYYDWKVNQEIIIAQSSKKKKIFRIRNIIRSQEEKQIQQIKVNLEKEKTFKEYNLRENILTKKIGKKNLYVVNKNLAIELIKNIHVLIEHIGMRKTWIIFRETFYCKLDAKITKEQIRKCLTYQL